MVTTTMRAEGQSQLIGAGVRTMVLRAKLADGTRAAALIGNMPKPLTSETSPRWGMTGVIG